MKMNVIVAVNAIYAIAIAQRSLGVVGRQCCVRLHGAL